MKHSRMPRGERVPPTSNPQILRKRQKNGVPARKLQNWVNPPEEDAEFAACMEEVLETY